MDVLVRRHPDISIALAVSVSMRLCVGTAMEALQLVAMMGEGEWWAGGRGYRFKKVELGLRPINGVSLYRRTRTVLLMAVE